MRVDLRKERQPTRMEMRIEETRALRSDVHGSMRRCRGKPQDGGHERHLADHRASPAHCGLLVLGSMTQEVMTRHIEHRPKQEMRLSLERLGLDEQARHALE